VICGHVSTHSTALVKKKKTFAGTTDAGTDYAFAPDIVVPVRTGQEKQISEGTDEIQVSAPRTRGSLKSGRISIFHRLKDF